MSMSALKAPTRYNHDLYESMLEQIETLEIKDDDRGAVTTRTPAVPKK